MEGKFRIDTTLGELIETVSEAAFEVAEDPREAYVLAGLVLAEILQSHSMTKGFAGAINPNFPRKNYFH